ncbi:glutamate receptor ionotropic, delta-1 isoform X2 [Monomorium pharaonis]|uniref:glutamate receptor ionotropic, delta-1 isoform X2 n=1 Tax=Monomorium pharaonis TaxID=307658 RepID=UPI0017479FC2|nr:glutamate receptor ionotropic, delta-1 isoform X2 [Monomorium pharaonis]
MRSFRQLSLGTFIFATCYCITHGKNDTSAEQSSVEASIPAEMKITSWNDMPFSGIVKENGTWVGKGYAFHLLELLSSKLNFTYTIVPPKHHVLGNSQQGILNLLYEKVDMAVAFLPILPELRKYCTFSVTLEQSELTVLMKRPQESATGGLLAPFNETVWLLVLTAVISLGPIIYILAMFRRKLWNKPDSENYSLSSCVWFVYSCSLKQGSNMKATTDSTRILFATWWIFILILTSFYTANLTAFLTKPQFTLPINNVRDLMRKGYHWVTYKGRTLDFLLSQFYDAEDLRILNATRWKGPHIASYEHPIKDIFQTVGKKKVFLGEAHFLQSLIFEDYVNKTREYKEHKKRCTYVITPHALLATNKAFAFPLNSTLEKPFNKELLTLVESGIIQHEKLKNLPIAQICPLDLRSKERRLSLENLSLTFRVVIVGYAIAIVIFVVEIAIKWMANSNKRRKKIGKWYDRTSLCSRWKRRSKESVLPQLVYTTKNQLFDKRVNLQKINMRPPYPNFLHNVTKTKKHINGRDYYIVLDRYGDQRLIPIRTPSAFLFQYTA